MAGETIITIVGNLVSDPELRFTPSGAPVANFTVASTPRRFNKETGAWEDQDALFMRCGVWRQAAENVAESLEKGARVIVTGRLKQRSYEDREGQQRTVVELDVDEIGPSLKWATAKVAKVGRDNNQSAQSSGGDPWASGGAPAAGGDPWATGTPASPAAAAAAAAPTEEPPF